MHRWMALAASPAVPAPPLVGDTVLVAIIGGIVSIVLLILGNRLNRRETTASPPAATTPATATADPLGQHDLDVAEQMGRIKLKLTHDYERLGKHDDQLRDVLERVRAIEHKLGITPDPARHTGGNQP